MNFGELVNYQVWDQVRDQTNNNMNLQKVSSPVYSQISFSWGFPSVGAGLRRIQQTQILIWVATTSGLNRLGYD